MQIEERDGRIIAKLEFTHTFYWKDELTEAVASLKERSGMPGQRITLLYKSPVSLPVWRNRPPRSQVTGVFFDHPEEGLCFSLRGRTGYNVRYMEPLQLEELSVPAPRSQEEYDRQDQLERERFIARVKKKRFDEFVWNELSADCFSCGCRFYDIRKAFDSADLAKIRLAFETKTALKLYRQSLSKRGRDFRIEMKPSSDGEYRAWFTSYYPGTGNGDFYALIGPETAVFLETD